MKKYSIPDIPKNKQTPLVISLLQLLENFFILVRELRETIVRLKDEIAILKGEKKRPKFKGSKLDERTNRSLNNDSLTENNDKKRAGSKKKDKTSHLVIHEKKVIPPAEPVPAGSRFKGYREFVVQDIIVQPYNTLYRAERWITPDGKTLTGTIPEETSHFGTNIIQYILYQHYHCHTTQPLLLEQLREWGIEISSGQINNILITNKEKFHQEKDDLLIAGLQSDYVTVDDSGARHKGNNGYVTHIGNDLFCWFCSTDSKSKINFLKLLREKAQNYIVKEDALIYMREKKLPEWALRKLQAHKGKHFADDSQWQELLEKEGINKLKHRRIATEAMLISGILAGNNNHDLAIISDDAGQFNVLIHGLCWVHAERHVHKLIPFNEIQRKAQAKVRDQIWSFYKKLKIYKKQPSKEMAETLSIEFDEIFTQKTGFPLLDQVLERIFKNKKELLLVLDRPEVPLHTNGSEGDIRDFVRKRKVSGCTRSDEGRLCRDTFASLKKTCRIHGISFWDYLGDRLRVGPQKIPWLPDIIRKKIMDSD